jgi:peptide/nickel transport system substrate-binding protein
MRGSRRARRARFAGALAIALAIALCGCDGGEDESAVGEIVQPGGGGTLTWALGERPRQLDPLLATSRADLLLARQIYEPLTATVTSPFGEGRSVPALARSARPSRNETVWRLTLREPVRFQDGTPLDARAVVANAERWRTLAAGRELLPNLSEVDAPQPDLVRFFLDRPDPEFDQSLASPRLGIVSPSELRPRSGVGAEVRDPGQGGTGPFELRERTPEFTLIARNVNWWGTARQLGPALDQVEFRVVPGAEARYRLLRAGDAQLAGSLGPEQVARLRRDPLLTALPAAGDWLGLERSVRGIESGRVVPSLSGVWLTRIGAD